MYRTELEMALNDEEIIHEKTPSMPKSEMDATKKKKKNENVTEQKAKINAIIYLIFRQHEQKNDNNTFYEIQCATEHFK